MTPAQRALLVAWKGARLDVERRVGIVVLAAVTMVVAAAGARLDPGGAAVVAADAGEPPTRAFDGGATSPDAGAMATRRAVIIDRSLCETSSPLEFVYRLQKGPGEEDAVVRWRLFLEVLTSEGATPRSHGSREVRRVEPGVSARSVLTGALSSPRAAVRLEALRAARRRAPDDPLIGLHLAREARATGEVDEAILGYGTFLAAYPVPELKTRLSRLEADRDRRREFQRREDGGLRVLWPSGAVTSQQVDLILDEVRTTLEGAAFLLGAPRRERLTVIVHRSREELVSQTCAPLWTGGLYDGAVRVSPGPAPLGVNAHALRHEVFHAALASTDTEVPTWFNEGAAAMFSGRDNEREAWSRMVRSRTWIPFSSLEGGFREFEASADAHLAYAQARAMVELVRECGGFGAIGQARRDFDSGHDSAQVLARACQKSEVTGEDLLEFLVRRLER